MFETGHARETETYADLRNRALRALARDEIQKAEKLSEWAYNEARLSNNSELMERAYCNRAMVANINGDASRFIRGLRTIVSQSQDPGSRYLAAYNLAGVFQDQRLNRKARFYAEVAFQQAEGVEDPMIAAAAHMLGLLWLADSRFQRAQKWIETSLEILELSEASQIMAMKKSTLGYCLALMNQPGPALAVLESSVGAITHSPCRLYEANTRLNFGFSLLEMGQVEWAADQALLALEAVRQGPTRKYALFLLGESLAYLHRPKAARAAFQQLQQEFFPGVAGLADELLANRIHGVISWLA